MVSIAVYDNLFEEKLKMNRIFLYSLILFFGIPVVGYSSDGRIYAEGLEGQGYFREFQGQCYMITAAHVVQGAINELEITTRSNDIIPFSTIQIYKDDIAVLKLVEPYAPCLKKNWFPGENLDSIIEHNKEGEIRFVKKDIGTKIIPVEIVSKDYVTSFTIRPKEQGGKFMQGYSGSPVYIGDVVVGMLTEVAEYTGIVLRQDYLNNVLITFFQQKSGNNFSLKDTQASINSEEPSKLDLNQVDVDVEEKNKQMEEQVITDSVVEGDKKTYEFMAEKNSSYVITFDTLSKNLLINVRIIGEVGQDLHKQRVDRRGSFAFTPTSTGKHKLVIDAIKYSGKYTFKISQFANNADLISKKNVLDPGSNAKGKIAIGARAEYKFMAEKNSPLVFSFEKPISVGYKAIIQDQGGKSVLDIPIASRSGYNAIYGSYPFTPLTTGAHTLLVLGTIGHGTYEFNMGQIATDSELSAESNILNPAKPVNGLIAVGAKATYKFNGRKGSELFLHFDKPESVQYKVVIEDSSGNQLWDTIIRFLRGSTSTKFGSFSFLPPSDGEYSLKIIGLKGYGHYTITLSQ